jgi:hypothetical protein
MPVGVISHMCLFQPSARQLEIHVQYFTAPLYVQALQRMPPPTPTASPTGLTNVIHVTNLLLSSSIGYCIVSFKVFLNTQASKIYFQFLRFATICITVFRFHHQKYNAPILADWPFCSIKDDNQTLRNLSG